MRLAANALSTAGKIFSHAPRRKLDPFQTAPASSEYLARPRKDNKQQETGSNRVSEPDLEQKLSGDDFEEGETNHRIVSKGDVDKREAKNRRNEEKDEKTNEEKRKDRVDANQKQTATDKLNEQVSKFINRVSKVEKDKLRGRRWEGGRRGRVYVEGGLFPLRQGKFPSHQLQSEQIAC